MNSSTTARAREAVCNTSPIQYLHQTGLLHLLAEYYSRTLIPPAVAHELERGRAIGINLPEIEALPWVKIQPPEGLDKVPTEADLGAGEIRLHAAVLKLTFTVLRARAEGQISRIAPVLEQLDRLRFRLSPKTRAGVLKLAGEDPV